MEKVTSLGIDEVQHLATEAQRLEKRISFKDYLLHLKFTQLGDGFFAQTSPPQLIQLVEKEGKSYYINHAVSGDTGTLMDFITNRLDPNGKVIPLYGQRVSELLVAVDIARLYLKGMSPSKSLNHGLSEKQHGGRRRVSSNSKRGLNTRSTDH